MVMSSSKMFFKNSCFNVEQSNTFCSHSRDAALLLPYLHFTEYKQNVETIHFQTVHVFVYPSILKLHFKAV